MVQDKLWQRTNLNKTSDFRTNYGSGQIMTEDKFNLYKYFRPNFGIISSSFLYFDKEASYIGNFDATLDWVSYIQLQIDRKRNQICQVKPLWKKYCNQAK